MSEFHFLVLGMVKNQTLYSQDVLIVSNIKYLILTKNLTPSLVGKRNYKKRVLKPLPDARRGLERGFMYLFRYDHLLVKFSQYDYRGQL
jgi:hypothetical protein